MPEMSFEERDAAEAEVRAALRGVRLVFELGFPANLVQKAHDVVTSAGAMIMNGSRVRYPASFVLTVVNLAKDRRDRTFWSAEALEPLRSQMHVSPQILGETTRATLEELRLETFDELIEDENALRNMTPVTMHSGIPVNNMRELVSLIETAARRYRYMPNEQIEYWSSSPNGFHGLWAAPRRLFQRGGAIALDLLDQVNEALRNPSDPGVSGLPEHLVTAIAGVTRGRHVFGHAGRGRNTSGVAAVVSIDAASTLGPVLQIPRHLDISVARWRITGSAAGDVRASADNELTVRLNPAKDYEVSAISASGLVLASRIIRTYGNLPVVFFDAVTGRLLQQSGRRIETEDRTVVALAHKKVDLEGVIEQRDLRVECEGAWEGWTVRTIEVPESRSLTVFDTAHEEDREELLFVRAISRPGLVHLSRPAIGLDSPLGEVFVAPPGLRLDIGGADPSLVKVVVEYDDGEEYVEESLADLEMTNGLYDLSSLFDGNGAYEVKVEGPIGLRMATQRILLLQGLDGAQNPPLGIPGTPINIDLTMGGWQGSCTAAPWSDAATIVVDGCEVRARPERIEWALSVGSGEPSVLGGEQFTFTAAEADENPNVFVHLRSNVPCSIDIDMLDGLSLVHSETVVLQGPRRSVSLRDFIKYAAEEGSEVHTLVGQVFGAPPFTLGRITSEYIVEVTASVDEADAGTAAVNVRFTENKPFENRVVRLWSLDRPWEQSLVLKVPDDERSAFTAVMPSGYRAGRYRLWMRIENMAGPGPRMPKPGTPGVADVHLTSGRGLDPENAVDRLLDAVQSNDLSKVREGDTADHGHVLIALLSRSLADSGSAGLSGRTAAVVYRLLENDTDHIIRHIATALDRDLVDEEWATKVSLALLPLLFEAEDKSDLSVEEDFSELVWTRLPLIAAAVEPWNESQTSLQKWNQKLGWPAIPDSALSDDDEDDSETVDEVVVADIPKRQVLTNRFDQDMRLVCNLPDGPRPRSEIESVLEVFVGGLIGSRDGMALSVDAEWKSVVESVPRAFVARREVSEWRVTHGNAISRAHSYLRNHEFKYLVDQYQARSVWMDDPQYKWVFFDIVVLAFSGVDDREHSDSQMAALVDALEFAPVWVEYALMLALSARPFYAPARARRPDPGAVEVTPDPA